jgi:thiol-disulfide isomerase/thioredoxin
VTHFSTGWRPADRLLIILVLGLGVREARAAAPAPETTSTGVLWASSFDTAMEQARSEHKFVMVDFYTGWCHWCKVLDEKTYSDPTVAARSTKLVNVKVNAEVIPALSGKYGVRGYPTIVFLNPDGSLRQRVVGYKSPEQFLPVLDDVFKTESELYALRQQVIDNPRDARLRRDLAQTLALSGDFLGAATQIDSLLLVAPGAGSEGLSDEERSGSELDRWIYLHRAGGVPDAREGLEKWIKKEKNHPRRIEGQFYLAQAEAKDGRGKQSRKLYQEIAKKQPGSWFAEVARAKLARG